MIKKILFLFLIVLLVNCQAQELSQMRISGKPEPMPGELIGREVMDVNGAVCAGIIVTTDLSGFSFTSGNNIVKVNSNPGKYFVFLSPGERYLQIYCTGFEPLKIILNEINIQLHSGEVWQIRVTGNKKSDRMPIIVSAGVDGALINIDGYEKGTDKTQWVSLGKHKLVITKTGYKTVTSEIEVTEKNVLFNFTPEKIRPVKFTIKTSPVGAKVFINGTERGESNYQSFEIPGRYSLKLSRPGFLEQTKEIEIQETGANE
ncbi:MAG: PEGA domain-containing protein, partial [Ignavibacteria bacterium]